MNLIYFRLKCRFIIISSSSSSKSPLLVINLFLLVTSSIPLIVAFICIWLWEILVALFLFGDIDSTLWACRDLSKPFAHIFTYSDASVLRNAKLRHASKVVRKHGAILRKLQQNIPITPLSQLMLGFLFGEKVAINVARDWFSWTLKIFFYVRRRPKIDVIHDLRECKNIGPKCMCSG